MNLEKERERLSQASRLQDLQDTLDPTSMVTVFLRPSAGSDRRHLSSILIPVDQIKFPFPDNNWRTELDLMGLREFRWDSDGTWYPRLGAAELDERVRCLVIPREFYGWKEDYLEICEDFRLFNNLHFDKEANKYLTRDRVDDGYADVEVAVVEPNCVKMLGKKVRQFLLHTKMYLLLRFSSSAYSEYSLEELGICQNEVKSDEAELPDGYLSWECTYRETREEGYQTESTLRAMRLIGYSKVGEKQSVEFIIGVDENGHEIYHTSRLESAMFIGTHWSPNPIVVHFNKEVLDEYYLKSDIYTVEDMVLLCHDDNGEAKWNLPIDDDHDGKVCVLLVFLSLLPYEELLHWRKHNIPPEGDLSETYYKRYAQEIPTESKQLGHLFRNRYHRLNQLCNAGLGWELLLPLDPGDKYHLRCLRVPFSDNQVDFDGLILSLTKILVDSLNQERLKELISDQEQAKLDQKKDGPKGIDYLEAALSSFKVENAKCYIKFLRRLQGIRSTGSAHRKGKSYRRSVKYFKLEQLGLRQGFAEILRLAIEVLEFFIHIVQRGELSGRKEVSLLYDLNERLGALFETLFPSESEGVFTDETWMRETVQWSRHLAEFLLTKVVPKFDCTPSELMNFCEQSITSLNPDATPADIRSAITDIAKVFIREAPSQLQYATSILSQAEGTSMPTTEGFEKPASRVTYSKKLVDFSLGFVNHDEVADSAWYRHYVAHLLRYVSCYTAYTYTHVLRAEELDSEPVISELVSIVRRAADVTERIAGDDARSQLQTVRKAAEHLAQAIEQQ